MRQKHIGNVGVDSGQLMVCDPCYVEYWKDKPFTGIHGRGEGPFEFSYDGACQATTNENKGGEMAFPLGHAGAGVAFSSGYGDGVYPVYAEYNSEGRLVRVTIEMG